MNFQYIGNPNKALVNVFSTLQILFFDVYSKPVNISDKFQNVFSFTQLGFNHPLLEKVGKE